MSGPLMKAVWDRGPADHNQFVVLLTLARFANDDGESCWPTVATIAAKARICERNVKSAIKALPTDGWITVMRKSQDPSWIATGLKDKKGNSYRVSLSRLGEVNSGAPHAPKTTVSGAPHALESSAPATPEIKSQVQNPSKSGAESVKPPDPLNGVTTKNQYIPTAPMEPAGAQLVLTPEEQKPSLSKRAQKSVPNGQVDPRFEPCMGHLSDYWKEHNSSFPFSPGPAGGAQLKTFLASHPELTVELFAAIVRNRSLSKQNHSEPPHKWLTDAIQYASGPLNEFNRPLQGYSPPKVRNGVAKPSGAEQAEEDYRRQKESLQKVTVMNPKTLAAHA
jgi:Helix-turn-helix domain